MACRVSPLLPLLPLLLHLISLSAACHFDVTSGDVTATTAIVQASLFHSSCRPPSSSSSPVLAGFRLSRDPSLSADSIIVSRTLRVFPHAGLDPRANPGGYVAKLSLRDLRPDTHYYYTFHTVSTNHTSPISSFRTLPSSSGKAIRFVVATALNQPPYSVLRHAVAYRSDFTILAGDGIYPVKEWSTSTTESAEPPSATSDFYRNLYASEQRSAVYGGGDWLPMLLRQSATFAIWDDHDIYPDIAGASGHPRVVNDETTIPYNDTGYDGLPQSEDLIPPQSAAAFFRVGTSVFLESFGIQSASTLALQDPLPSSIYIPTARRRRLNLQRQPSVALPVLRNDERRLFRKISLPDADLFLLDTRQYRDVPIPGEPGVLIPVLPKGVGKNFTCEGKYASPQFCLLLRGPHGGGDNVWRGAAQRGRTMLGDVQFQWLKNGLRKSDKNKVKIIVSTVFFFQAFLSPEESWQGYWGERQRLLKFIERNGIEKVVFLSSGVLGTIITRLNPFVGDERLAVHEITIGAGGRYTGGALLGPAVPIFENFVRLFSENGHLLPEEKRPNKFIAIDKSNFVKVRVEKGGRMIAECVGDDGEVIVDRAGKVCRLTVG